MSSHSRTESPGSKSRLRLSTEPVEDPAEDALAVPGPSTDDTPTIISRQPPLPLPTSQEGESANSVRGRRLAHFELIEPIGVGGMAAVIRARDTQLDRFVALKILPPEMAHDAENIRRFHQEARSAAKLDHENIARVFFCGEDQNLHFIAFEFVEGENLRAILERRGRIPVGEAVHYMLQVAAGLAHASQRGVVHRDIKPSNIIVTPNGRAKLVDMGLARCLRTEESALTQSGVTLGTFDYISPEQALEPRDADVRSDIYSLGCTFYHMLTGRAPVPEGTAAKKLHHHQHVKPVDPRQYVPDLPVEAVLILDRMMAKQPRDRFQSPEELVHQFVLVHRKLGSTAEVPEGVLAVEASLPTAPVSRPLLWAALAAAAVVGLVFLLDQAAPTGNPGRQGVSIIRPAVESTVNKGVGVPPVPGKGNPRPAPQPADVAAGGGKVFESGGEPNVADLLNWLEQNRDASRIELRLAGDLDLSPREGMPDPGGLLISAKHIVIKPLDPKKPPTLRFSYNAQDTKGKPVVAVTVNARESSTIEGVRFVFDGHETPDTEMVSLLLQGGSHTIRRCQFVQAQPPSREDGKRQASVVAEAGKTQKTTVALQDCVFLGFGKLIPRAEREEILAGADAGGQDAVVRRGPVHLTAEGCVFGPHSAAFRLEGKSSTEGLLTVKHCSVLLAPRRSAVFEVTTDRVGDLQVEHSLFSRLSGLTGEADVEGAVLLRQTDNAANAITYRGRDNCYHDLDGYWTTGGDWQQAGWDDFLRKLTNSNSPQDQSRVLGVRPWVLEPAAQIEALERVGAASVWNQQKLNQAFRLRLDLTALRQASSPTEVVGAGSILGQEKLKPLDEKTEPLVARNLVVDPKCNDSSHGQGIFQSLDGAVGSARPGDTILIRHNGVLPIDPVHLNKKGLSDLTIRPARRFQPVLVLGETADADTALFRVHDGKLRLEGLEFWLMKRKLTMQTVITLVGDGECTLRKCVVTLQRSGDGRVALATVAEPGKVMKLDMPPARKKEDGPLLRLENCFVRGEGDLLWTRASRPFALEAKKSLAALSGSVLNIEINADSPPVADSLRTVVELQGTTTYLGGPLVRLSTGKDPRALTAVRFTAKNCLFVPAAKDRSMIVLDGKDPDGTSLGGKWAWEGGPNVYGPFSALLKQLPGGTEMPPPALTAEKWKGLPGEDASTFAAEFQKAPLPSETNFSRMEPGQFLPPKEAADGGAPLSGLPKPSSRPLDGTAKEP